MPEARQVDLGLEQTMPEARQVDLGGGFVLAQGIRPARRDAKGPTPLTSETYDVRVRTSSSCMKNQKCTLLGITGGAEFAFVLATKRGQHPKGSVACRELG
jgi:hypothetical protein